MTTVVGLISRSLRLLGVLDAGQAAEGDDYVTARDVLNAMLARWEANGLALGWSDALVADADVTLPAEAVEAVAYNLACKLAPEYGVPVREDVVTDARDGLAALRRDRLVEMPLTSCSDLPSAGHWNIYTDEPV